MTVLGYARVSTPEQDLTPQLDALTAAGCAFTYRDTASGALASRPQLDALIEALSAGDTLVVVRLDRLGRSLRHLIELVGRLAGRGVSLRSLTEAIDTSTSTGRLVLHIFGALGEFERELIRERTMAALASARARGRLGGRVPVMTVRKRDIAIQMHNAGGHTLLQIAETLGVSRASVGRSLRAYRLAEVARGGWAPDLVSQTLDDEPDHVVIGGLRLRTQGADEGSGRIRL